MAPRQVAGDALRDVGLTLTPNISPVDIFQPGAPRGAQTEKFLGAIAKLDQQLRPTFQREFKEAKDTEIAEGEALFQQNRKDFKEAVRSGAIPAGASPYVRKGYRRSELHALGASYATQMARALETSEIYKTEDPAAIEQYMGEFYEKFIETNGIGNYDEGELAESFLPMIQRSNDMFRQRQSARNIEWVEQQRFEAFDQEVYATLDMQGFDGSASSVNSAINDTAAFLKAKVDELDAEGLDRTKINRRVVDVITSAALEREDTDVLEVLKRLEIGTGPIGNTKYAREQAAQVEDRIERMRMAKAAAARSAAAAARTAHINSLKDQAALASQNGDMEAFEEAREALGRVSAWEVYSLDSKQAAREDRAADSLQRENWGKYREAASDLEMPDEELLEFLAEGVAMQEIPSGEADRMRQERQELRDTPELAGWLATGSINQIKSQIGGAIDSSTLMDFNGEDKAAALEAEFEFRRQMMDFWKQREGKFEPGEDVIHAQKVAKQLVDTYRRQQDQGGSVDLSGPPSGAQKVPDNNPGFFGRVLQNGIFGGGNTSDIPD